MTYLVTYDISDPKRLRKTAKSLERSGVRIQKSVFILEVNQHKIRSIRNDLEQIAGPEGDILIVPICSACNNRVKRLGPENETFVIA
ncbi:CRISPR-associated endonuclease Cas2 [Spirochaeta dissipatitropha]